MPARDGYIRIIFIQEVTGMVVDIGALMAQNTASPTVDEKRMAFDGTERVLSRTRLLEVPIHRECDIQYLRIMADLEWPVTAYLFGMAVHDIWAVGELLDVQDARRGAGNMAGAIARLSSIVFDGAFGQSDNLIGNIPWECTESILIPGEAGSGSGSLFGSGDASNWKLLETYRKGFEGPTWDPRGDGASVDVAGQLTKSAGGNPILDLVLPCQGSTLRLGGEDVLFSLLCFDWSGNLLSSVSKTDATEQTIKIPDGTWTIRLSVDSAGQIPEVTVDSPGRAVDPRVGLYVGDDGVVTGIPSWTS